MSRYQSLTHCSLVVAAATVIVACRATPTVTPVPTPLRSARACPAPELRGVEWLFVHDSTGFTFALPLGFQERPSAEPFRHFALGADFQQSMSVGIIRGQLGLEGYRRVYQPAVMLDYSECSDTVGGYKTHIQAWRTPNGIIRNYRRSDRYDVFAITELRPGVYIYLTGGTYSRATQDLLLGAIRAWRFDP